MKIIRKVLLISALLLTFIFIDQSTGAASSRSIIDHNNVICEKAVQESSPSPTPEITPTPTGTPTPTATPEPTVTPKTPSAKVRVGKKTKRIYEINGKFIKKNGVIKFKTSSGKTYKKGFFLYRKHIYFAQKKTGQLQRSWKKYKGNVYCFSRKDGHLYRSKKFEGVAIGKNGTAKSGKLNIARALTYAKAASIAQRITSKNDSKSKKLYKCYKWVMRAPYVRHRTMKQMMKSKNWRKKWDIVFANDIFEKHSGCCVSYSAAFALLAKECGYKKVTLCCDTGHAWDDIGGRLYDPLFAHARVFADNYNAKYKDYRINPAITKKIS